MKETTPIETMKLISMIIFTLSLFHTRNKNQVLCTIDVNLSELEYLAGHLEPSECRRLVAALHYNSFELPESIAGAERKIDEDIPCLRQLLHWNSSPGEGRGQTHEDIEHRLRQINRNDLADWLGKTTFKQLGNDLGRALDHPFGDQGMEDTESQSPATLEPMDEPPEEDPWLPVDTILFATVVVLLAALMTVCIAMVIRSVKLHRYQKNNYNTIDQEKGNYVPSGNQIQNKKLKTKKKKKVFTMPRKNKEESQDKNLLIQAKKKTGCCGTKACNIL